MDDYVSTDHALQIPAHCILHCSLIVQHPIGPKQPDMAPPCPPFTLETALQVRSDPDWLDSDL